MSRTSRIIGLTLLGVGVLLAAGLLQFGGYALAGVNYLEAPPAVKSLGQHARLNFRGNRFYYVGAPRIVDKSVVQKACAALAGEGLMGCYDGRIYILNIEAPEFRPEMTVTAAHETLHAIYQSLSGAERKRTDALLTAELDRRHDSKLNDRINTYHDRDSQLDEAFAVFGSEAPDASLSSGLRQEFDQFFTDRDAVVAINQQFQASFDNLENQINEMKTELNRRKVMMNELLGEGDVAAYNTQVGSYNDLVKRHNDLVNQYNDLGKRFNRAIGG